MRSVYFDTSVFLAIFKGEPQAKEIRQLFRELKLERIRAYTSIITIEEVSVLSFRYGTVASDNHSKVSRLARVIGISRETALTAAKFEAQLIDPCAIMQFLWDRYRPLRSSLAADRAPDIIRPRDDREKAAENRRRRWDCFHIATAVELGCEALYSGDKKMLTRKEHLKLGSLKFLLPKPEKPSLLFDAQKEK